MNTVQTISPILNTYIQSCVAIKNTTIFKKETLLDVAFSIKNSSISDIPPSLLANGEENPKYLTFKLKRNAYIFNGTFSNKRNKDYFEKANDIMYFDYDHFQSKEDAIAERERIIKLYPSIILCALSLSGKGLHIIMHIENMYTDCKTTEDFYERAILVYDYINHNLFDSKLCTGGKGISHAAAKTFDASIYINYNPIALDLTNVDLIPDNHLIKDFKYHKSTEIDAKQYYTSDGIGYTLDQIYTDDNTDDIAFEAIINQEIFSDNNTQLYFPSGIPYIRLNTECYINSFKTNGERRFFIGAVSMVLIYRNKSKDMMQVLKQVYNINYWNCKPHLSQFEVSAIFFDNLRKLTDNEVAFDNMVHHYNNNFIKHLWSKDCTLSSSYKKKISNQLEGQLTIDNTINKINSAIETLKTDGDYINQKSIVKLSGISIATVKRHWNVFKSDLKQYNDLLKTNGITKHNIEAYTSIHMCDTFSNTPEHMHMCDTFLNNDIGTSKGFSDNKEAYTSIHKCDTFSKNNNELNKTIEPMNEQEQTPEEFKVARAIRVVENIPQEFITNPSRAALDGNYGMFGSYIYDNIMIIANSNKNVTPI